MNKRIKTRLKWLEAAFYIGGAALLAIFLYIRFDSDRQREEGVRAFQRAVETQVAMFDPESGTNILATVTEPDKALWDKSRIDRYEQAMQVEAEPPLGILTIEKLDIEVPVYDGTDEFTLNRGVGRIEGTARIDVGGNLGIAGHRDGFFRGLKDIAIDDSIALQTIRGLKTYTVSSITIVDPSDVSVLENTEERTLTLVTCYPFYFVGQAPKRFIVKAIAEHSLTGN